MTELYLNDELSQYWQGKDIFQTVFALNGEIYRAQKNRQTLRVVINQKTYFVKRHQGVGWQEIFKNLLYGRWPVLGAKQEWRAIQLFDKLSVSTMHLAGYGERGCNPAQLQSFLVTEELADTISLEDYCRNWPSKPPLPAVKRTLIEKVASIARTLHSNGVNHRDFYLCHFLLNKNLTLEQLSSKNFALYLIDLHRVQIRPVTPLRWVIKDLAGLYFSSMEIGLTRLDRFRFIKHYYQKPLSFIWREHKDVLLSIVNRGQKQIAKERLKISSQ